MASLGTIKAVNPAQLSAELGNVPLELRGDEGVNQPKTVVAPTVTQAQLNAAVAAHVAAYPAPPPNLRADLIAKLDAAIVGNIMLLQRAKPATAAAQASMAWDTAQTALRQLTTIMRLMRNQTDTTDGT